MATPVESANLILKLYELRREPVMREARNYFMSFDPRSVGDYMAAMAGPHSGHIRMVTSYWEMAASFVVGGAIDAGLFEASAGEQMLVFGKIEPFLPELRQAMGNPNMLRNLEQLCVSAPGGLERVRAMVERIRGMMAARAAS